VRVEAVRVEAVMRCMVRRRPRHNRIIRINRKTMGHHHKLFMLRPLACSCVTVEEGRQVLRPRAGGPPGGRGLVHYVPQGLLAAGLHVPAAVVGQGQRERGPGPVDAHGVGSGQPGLRGLVGVVARIGMSVGATDCRTINVTKDFAACHPTSPFPFKVNLQ
jgi:hypothetical protein